jgi:hypothetical protein
MEHVIEGEVLRGPEVVRPLPKKRRRRWPWIVGAIAAVVALCLAIPVAVIAIPIIRRTIEAGQGSNSPQEALLSFVLTIDTPAERKRLEAERLIIPSKRKTISQQRTDFINAMDTDNQRHPDQTARLAVAYDELHQDQVNIDGNNATVTAYWRARWEMNTGTAYVSEGLPWTATAERQSDGWRLTSVTMPTWCGAFREDGTATGYAKC